MVYFTKDELVVIVKGLNRIHPSLVAGSELSSIINKIQSEFKSRYREKLIIGSLDPDDVTVSKLSDIDKENKPMLKASHGLLQTKDRKVKSTSIMKSSEKVTPNEENDIGISKHVSDRSTDLITRKDTVSENDEHNDINRPLPAGTIKDLFDGLGKSLGRFMENNINIIQLSPTRVDRFNHDVSRLVTWWFESYIENADDFKVEVHLSVHGREGTLNIIVYDPDGDPIDTSSDKFDLSAKDVAMLKSGSLYKALCENIDPDDYRVR